MKTRLAKLVLKRSAVKSKPILAVIILAASGFMASNAFAQGYTYRYVNDDGVQVMGNSIPPKYVHKGYEVLSPRGTVIRVVEPALPPEQIAVERELAELRAKYEHLAKRYSSVRDIEAAKQRKLVDVEASLILAEGNVRSVQKEIDVVMSQAADYERAGKKVPKSVLKALSILNNKMTATVSIRDDRAAEKAAVVDRFEKDKELFVNGVKTFDPEDYAEKTGMEKDEESDAPASDAARPEQPLADANLVS